MQIGRSKTRRNGPLGYSSKARAFASALAASLILLLFPPGAESQTRDLRYTVMVGRFENHSGWRDQGDINTKWSTILTDKLNQTGRFIVVGRDMRQQAMDEQAFAASGVTAQGRHAPVRGQMTPSQLLVRGIITHFEQLSAGNSGGLSFKGVGFGTEKQTAQIGVTLEIVDSSTGMIVASKSVVGESSRKKKSFRVNRDGVSGKHQKVNNDNVKTAMESAVTEAVGWMVGQLDTIPWRGTVALVEGDVIYINRGRREGVTEGLMFTVGEAKVIRDPDTGEVLDEFITERGRLRAVRVNEKTSLCQVTSGDVSTILKGMGVMPTS